MPSTHAAASAEPSAIAPDGIAIHGFALPSAWLMSMVEGRIPPGRFGTHRHLTLDQITYVLRGTLTVVTDGSAGVLAAGEALLTTAGESLQFSNEGGEEVRVLFICAPPYPLDDSDTVTVAQHAPLSAEERAAARARLKQLRAEFTAAIDARLQALA